MHLVMILAAMALALVVRLITPKSTGNWSQRWHKSLFLFLFPPLLLMMTALAIVCMGADGQMLGLKASWLGYGLGSMFLVIAAVLLFQSAHQAWQSQQEIGNYPQEYIQGKKARILETNLPYSAQIGLWQPHLVISQGLLALLNEEHLEAVLAHEQAHLEYRDTFCFFWLGWLRSLTTWLPNTENLWQELLLLREIRADRRATKQVDSLVLAESLLSVAQFPMESSVSFCAPLGSSCLTQRIDSLMENETHSSNAPSYWSWMWVLLVLIPWATIPLHY